MDTVEVGGLRIAYEQAGVGPTLVLLHGFVGDGPSTWRRQVDDLCGEFTVVAWDAPGAGRSSDPPSSFRMADYADCLAAFLSALGFGPVHLGGLSFGGALALEVYRRHPTVPATLTLASAYAGWAGSLPADVVAQRLDQCLRAADLAADQFVELMVPTMFSGATRSPLLDAFSTSVAEFHPGGFRTMASALAEADLRDVLPRIRVPTLLLYGDADVRAPSSVAEHLHKAITGSELVVLPGVGHVNSVEAPDLVTNTLRAFLCGAPG